MSDLILTDELDFAAMLEASFAERRFAPGDIVTGTILSVGHHGLIIDVNWKQDGIVPRGDLERMGMLPGDFQVDETIDVSILRLEDRDGNLILSASQARQYEDWNNAEALQENDETAKGEVAAANKGGLIIPFGHLRGFIPASHVVDLPRGTGEDERLQFLKNMVGEVIAYKVIEVDRKRRRLVFSQRYAERETRNARKQMLLDELNEGDIREGVVSGLCDFGAFVDLGGADGLIHISELAWHRVHDPSEIVKPGEKVKVQILHLDEEGNRIGLSLKRLQQNPWAIIEEKYHIGQLVEGLVTRLETFGAFITLEEGIEALLHVSQISEDSNVDPRRELRQGETILTRIISIEADKQRLGLSLKEVAPEEREQWSGERGADDADEFEEATGDIPNENADFALDDDQTEGSNEVVNAL